MLGYAYHHWAPHVTRTLGAATVEIPLDDQTAYLLYPQYRWVFDKIQLSEAQGVPRTRTGSNRRRRVSRNPSSANRSRTVGPVHRHQDIRRWTLDEYNPGHFWMPVLPEPQAQHRRRRPARGRPLVLHDDADQHPRRLVRPLGRRAAARRVKASISNWVRTHLSEFTGVANFKTHDRWIIEAPLRLATQFLDFYGHGWFDSVVGLYEHRAWEAPGPASPAGTSLVLRLTQDEGVRRLRLTDPERRADLATRTEATVYLPWQNGQRLADANDDRAQLPVGHRERVDENAARRLPRRLVRLVDGLPEDTLEPVRRTFPNRPHPGTPTPGARRRRRAPACRPGRATGQRSTGRPSRLSLSPDVAAGTSARRTALTRPPHAGRARPRTTRVHSGS